MALGETFHIRAGAAISILSDFNPSLGLNFTAASQNLCSSAASARFVKAHEKNLSRLP
jgi:hypothetical protein